MVAGKRRLARMIVICIGAAVVTASVIWFGWYRSRLSPPLAKVRIAAPLLPGSALLLLAQEQGFFRGHGLEVQLTLRATGKDCLDLLLAHEVDLAQVYITPIAAATAQGHRLEIFTELHHAERSTAMVIRRDRIANEGDLGGKRIGFHPGTSTAFLLDLMLATATSFRKAVSKIPMPADEIAKTLREGGLDAGVLWEPYVSMLVAEAPATFAAFYCPFYTEFSLLVGLADGLPQQHEVLHRVLASLIDAEEFAQREPARVQTLLRTTLGEHGLGVPNLHWDQYFWELGLSATLMTMLEQESAWVKNQGIGSTHFAKQMVKVSPYLYDLRPQARRSQ